MKSVLIIPCYNEEKTIGQIVATAYKYVDLVMVIDDQSADRTGTMALFNGASVVKTQGQHGAGVAIRTGIQKALSANADKIVIMDGDGQHNPDEIPLLLDELDRSDMATFSRLSDGEQMPFYRRVGIMIINLAYNIFAKQNLSDSQCGFRGFQRNVLDSFKVTENGFAYSTEILIKARKLGFKIAEIPSKAIYHKDYKQNSTLNPFKHGFDVLWRTIKWRIKCELR